MLAEIQASPASSFFTLHSSLVDALSASDSPVGVVPVALQPWLSLYEHADLPAADRELLSELGNSARQSQLGQNINLLLQLGLPADQIIPENISLHPLHFGSQQLLTVSEPLFRVDQVLACAVLDQCDPGQECEEAVSAMLRGALGVAVAKNCRDVIFPLSWQIMGDPYRNSHDLALLRYLGVALNDLSYSDDGEMTSSSGLRFHLVSYRRGEDWSELSRFAQTLSGKQRLAADR